MFDVQKLKEYSIAMIKNFAEQHKDEHFYGFAIDDGLICFNSVEEFDKTLNYYWSKVMNREFPYESGNVEKAYKEFYPDLSFKDAMAISLKENTGDWKYQGFAKLDICEGYDCDLYQDYYDFVFEGGDKEEYTKMDYIAMVSLMKELEESNVFSCLNLTDDFKTYFIAEND